MHVPECGAQDGAGHPQNLFAVEGPSFGGDQHRGAAQLSGSAGGCLPFVYSTPIAHLCS